MPINISVNFILKMHMWTDRNYIEVKLYCAAAHVHVCWYFFMCQFDLLVCFWWTNFRCYRKTLQLLFTMMEFSKLHSLFRREKKLTQRIVVSIPHFVWDTFRIVYRSFRDFLRYYLIWFFEEKNRLWSVVMQLSTSIFIDFLFKELVIVIERLFTHTYWGHLIRLL